MDHSGIVVGILTTTNNEDGVQDQEAYLEQKMKSVLLGPLIHQNSKRMFHGIYSFWEL